MDLSTLGSISQYTKTAALKTQWNLKKKSGNVTAHSKGLKDFLSVSSVFSKTPEETDNEKLQKITNKVNVGAKLTDKEMEYLKEKNPQLYEKLNQIEREQKAYEEALRHCKSKDEAQRLHMARVGESMQAAKNGDGTATYRMKRMSESMTAFSETEEYKKLPTEAEQALEHRKQREAERAVLEPKVSETEEKELQQVEKAGESTPKECAKAADAEAPGESTAKTEKSTKSRETEPDEERPTISATPRLGARAYVTTQESKEQEKRRRSAIDTKA